jgi:hypothetical protein
VNIWDQKCDFPEIKPKVVFSYQYFNHIQEAYIDPFGWRLIRSAPTK